MGKRGVWVCVKMTKYFEWGRAVFFKITSGVKGVVRKVCWGCFLFVGFVGVFCYWGLCLVMEGGAILARNLR
jgi:hypothetical protein